MEYKGISASELADTIGVQRSNVTHVLHGRNKPSFQFIQKMLQIYPEINAKWLLLGTGNMVDSTAKPRTLFDQEPEKVNTIASTPDEVKQVISDKKITESEKNATEPIDITKNVISENSVQQNTLTTEKPIERLILCFDDQTFKVYSPAR